jgi:redox-sensitive bicupin YhaK (pirin superfamily)
VAPGEFALFPPESREIVLAALEPAAALFLTGAPIAEPIAGYGPFVMNSTEEIEEAVRDFRAGRMGRL